MIKNNAKIRPIYVNKIMTVIISIYLLKLILAHDQISIIQSFLTAMALGGGISLVEFGLGDYFLQHYRVQRKIEHILWPVNLFIARLVIGALIGAAITFASMDNVNLSSIATIVGIFIYSATSVILGVHNKIASVYKAFDNNYNKFNLILITIFLCSLSYYLAGKSVSVAIVIILYGYFVLGAYAISDLRKFNDAISTNTSRIKRPIRRAILGLENVMNSLTLMVLGLSIAMLSDKQDLIIFSVYSKVVNVIAMVGMLYILNLWSLNGSNAGRQIQAKIFKYFITLVFCAMVLVFTERLWFPIVSVEHIDSLSISLWIVFSLLFWRLSFDALSQITKMFGNKKLLIMSTVAQAAFISGIYVKGIWDQMTVQYIVYTLIIGSAFSLFILFHLMIKIGNLAND